LFYKDPDDGSTLAMNSGAFLNTPLNLSGSRPPAVAKSARPPPPPSI